MEHCNFKFFLDLDYRKISDQQFRETCQYFEYQLQYGAVQDMELQALATIVKCDERLYDVAATEIPSIRPCQWRSGIFAALGSYLGDAFLEDPSSISSDLARRSEEIFAVWLGISQLPQ